MRMYIGTPAFWYLQWNQQENALVQLENCLAIGNMVYGPSPMNADSLIWKLPKNQDGCLQTAILSDVYLIEIMWSVASRKNTPPSK